MAVYLNFKYGGHSAKFKFWDGRIFEYGGIFEIYNMGLRGEV
jgi:hypothetical protein